MKVSFVFSMSAILLSSSAQAQTKLKKATPKPTVAPSVVTSAVNPLDTDPKLPPLPKLTPLQQARLEIKVLKTYRGPMYQLEVVHKSQAEIIEAIAEAMKTDVFVQPLLKTHHYPTQIVRALSLKALLDEAVRSDGATAMTKTRDGALIFKESLANLPPETVKALGTPSLKGGPAKPASKNSSKAAQPGKQFSFNGRDVYVVPLPAKPAK